MNSILYSCDYLSKDRYGNNIKKLALLLGVASLITGAVALAVFTGGWALPALTIGALVVPAITVTQVVQVTTIVLTGWASIFGLPPVARQSGFFSTPVSQTAKQLKQEALAYDAALDAAKPQEIATPRDCK